MILGILITPREIAPVSKLIFYSFIMIIWSLSGLRIPLYLNKYFVLHLYYFVLLVRGIRVLVAGPSSGDVPGGRGQGRGTRSCIVA